MQMPDHDLKGRGTGRGAQDFARVRVYCQVALGRIMSNGEDECFVGCLAWSEADDRAAANRSARPGAKRVERERPISARDMNGIRPGEWAFEHERRSTKSDENQQG